MSNPTPQPLHPEDPGHAGEGQSGVDESQTEEVGTTIDPVDPLKRHGDDDMPGLDPIVPIIPSD
jgi:hypothetical protein